MFRLSRNLYQISQICIKKVILEVPGQIRILPPQPHEKDTHPTDGCLFHTVTGAVYADVHRVMRPTRAARWDKTPARCRWQRKGRRLIRSGRNFKPRSAAARKFRAPQGGAKPDPEVVGIEGSRRRGRMQGAFNFRSDRKTGGSAQARTVFRLTARRIKSFPRNHIGWM